MSTSSEAKFLSLEGIDGCGKSTQAQKLVERLNQQGIRTILVREPGGTRISEAIREILLERKTNELTARTESLLMTASRAQLTQEVILPNLEMGKWVIADRFTDSTLAYQGGGRNLDLDWLIDLNAFATNQLQPHLTFYLDVFPEESFRRRKVNQDRIEKEGLEFQARVRQTYLDLAQRFLDRIVVLNGHDPIFTIHEQIWKELERRHFLL
jgi:dTMP kinase